MTHSLATTYFGFAVLEKDGDLDMYGRQWALELYRHRLVIMLWLIGIRIGPWA